MRVNADGRSRSDARYKKLARRLGVSHAEAYGRCVWLWFELYEREGAHMSEEDIDIAAELDGFARAMIDSDLAEDTPDGIRIKGNERAGWVAKQREVASEGGRARALAATRKAGRFVTSTTNNQHHTSRSPAGAPASDQPSTSPLTLAPSPALSPAPVKDKGEPNQRQRPQPVQAELMPTTPPAMRQVTDEWQARYLERTGHKPSWDTDKGKTFGILKRLVDSVGADEVCRRIGILFTAPPRFLLETVPDVATLSQHFDKLAQPSGQGGQLKDRAGSPGLSPSELAKLSVEMMAEERKRGLR